MLLAHQESEDAMIFPRKCTFCKRRRRDVIPFRVNRKLYKCRDKIGCLGKVRKA